MSERPGRKDAGLDYVSKSEQGASIRPIMLDGELIIPRSDMNGLHILFTSLFVYTFNYCHHHQRASV